MPTAAIQNQWYELLRVTRSWRLEWNLEQLLQRVVREAVDFLHFEQGVIFLLGPEGVVCRVAWTKNQGQVTGATPRDIQDVAEKVVHSGRPVFAHLVDRRMAGKTARRAGGDALCVPLTAGRGILGALYVRSKQDAQRYKQNQQVLEMLGLQAAAALEHAILYQSAITDPLTGLYSHRHFQQEVEQAVRRALRADQKLSLLILDLDHFKALNDSEGHEVGNQCLIEVAQLLRKSLRAADIIARFGGDEFELLLPDTALSNAVGVAEKIRNRIGKLRFGKNRRVAGTIGAAAFPDNATDAQRLFLRADEALYKAKERGRNCTVASTFAEKLPKARALRAATSSENGSAPVRADRARQSSQKPAAIPDHMAAERIDGYSLVRRLGIGSTGEVLLVRQEELGREVALKRPLTPHLTQKQVDAFEREARITASLNHPGVISVFALGRDSDGRRYYTMRPINGMSLAEILERRRKEDLSITRAYGLSRLLEVIQRVAETIAYAHQRRIYHLDLTPANVVVGEFGEVTVIDWGASATRTGSRAELTERLHAPAGAKSKFNILIGSAGSLAPEQLPGSRQNLGAATDVHALGALLYEVLAGRGPYERENTQQTLSAILDEAVVPPEKAAPNAGIDPTLSLLSMSALRKDPRKRPTATEFAQRMGRYVRRETEFTVRRFGPAGHPVNLKDWKVEGGTWKVVDGELVTQSEGQSLILWKTALPGSFRFVVEGWIEKQGEIAIIGRTRPGMRGRVGYLFQFGAEWNTCTALARHAAIVGLIPQPRRRYRLELEYQEGWVFCYLDGEKVFEHRELFHFAGEQIGLYTCDPGVHFKPIEIQYQTWGLNIPAVRVADGHFLANDFEKAAGMYKELSRRLGQRLEGLESRLKFGMCMHKLAKHDQAVRVFRSLRNTILEPYALGQEALLEYRRKPMTHPRRSLKLFKQLAARHSRSAARQALVEASLEMPAAKTAVQNHNLAVEIRDLARNSAPKPTMIEIAAHVRYTEMLMHLGLWKRALEGTLSFRKKMLPTQRSVYAYDSVAMATMLAAGRADLLDADPLEARWWCGIDLAWPMNPVFHAAVLRNALGRLIRGLPKAGAARKAPDWYDATRLCALAAQGRSTEAMRLFERILFTDAAFWREAITNGLNALIDAGCHDAVRDYIRRFRAKFPDRPKTFTPMLAWSALQVRDFDTAARDLAEVAPDSNDQTAVTLRIFLSTLGVLKQPVGLLEKWMRSHLCGVPRQLAEMFLGKIDPVPGKLWPHPAFIPQFRLLLALWLEARGRSSAARSVVLPCRDSRFGSSNAQPAIEALLKRTGASSKS